MPLRHALSGGLFAAVLVEVAKALFGLFVSLFPGYQLIYGAFATVPLFLLWIYLSWLIVLFGAELVCNLSSSRTWRRRALPRLLVLLGVLRVFHDSQQRGLAVRHADEREGWPLPEDEWEELLDFLEREQLICRASGGGWVLCRDLGTTACIVCLATALWPLPRPTQLPEQLDEAWYPAPRDVPWACCMRAGGAVRGQPGRSGYAPETSALPDVSKKVSLGRGAACCMGCLGAEAQCFRPWKGWHASGNQPAKCWQTASGLNRSGMSSG